jgi:hypothetical protein
MILGDPDLRRRGTKDCVKKWVEVTLSEYDLVHASRWVISPFCASAS